VVVVVDVVVEVVDDVVVVVSAVLEQEARITSMATARLLMEPIVLGNPTMDK